MDKHKKTFLPDSLIGWLTVATLFIGLSASLYSSYTKPYYHIINLEKRMVRIEDQLADLKALFYRAQR